LSKIFYFIYLFKKLLEESFNEEQINKNAEIQDLSKMENFIEEKFSNNYTSNLCILIDERIRELSPKNILKYLKNKADLDFRFITENYRLNYEYLKLFLKISVYINEMFSLLSSEFIYFLVIWCYKNIILYDKKNYLTIIESTKYSCDYFFSLLTSKFVKMENGKFNDRIISDFIWIINNTINQSSNPFYFLLISYLIKKKINVKKFYFHVFKSINSLLIKPEYENREKFTLNNTINYTILIYNIISISNPRNIYLKKMKIFTVINEFLDYLIEDPIIFSQKAYKYTYTEANNNKHDFKILLEMVLDIFLDIDINSFRDLFFYNKEIKKLSNKDKYEKEFSCSDQDFDSEVKFNIDSSDKNLEIGLNQKEICFQQNIHDENIHSIFYYLDKIYFFSENEKIDNDIHNRIKIKIESNKKFQKGIETRDSIKFLYNSYTQYFLSKFISIYIIFKKEINNLMLKQSSSNNKQKLLNDDVDKDYDYFNSRISSLKILINILIQDMREIIKKYECLLNLRTFDNERNKTPKPSSNSIHNNKLENEIGGKSSFYFNFS